MTDLDAQALLDALPHAAAVCDQALALIGCNARFLELTGLDAAGAPGRSLRDPLPASVSSLTAAATGALRGRVEIARGARFRRGEVERHADVTFTPFLSGERRLVLVTAVDVSETEALRAQVARWRADETRLEQHVEERTRELLALQERHAHERRLAAVGQLAAGVMHDVNNALNPIMAAAFLLEANADDPAAVRDYATRIAKAAETGAATAARVGRFIRQEPPQDPRGAPIDLAELAEEVVAMMRPMWAERSESGVVRFEGRLTHGALVRGVAGELREALLNLVQNALDAMPEGGTLAIVTRTSEDEAIIEVSDSGVGMPREVRERAFDPFFTTKGARGSGLGLAEVYGIVRRHRGHAEIESDAGRGTTMRLRFPREAPEDDPVRETARGIARRRVLVVEDHADGREFMRTVLQLDGHLVEAVGSIADASARLALDDPARDASPFDVLVTDIGLPDGSGWDLVARARARWPALRLGVVTGWEPAIPVGAACDFAMRKPVRPAELLHEVAAV
ncbi:MAG TPA: ATP-binding protein [Gemmatimonadaceae bacterium]|nr:ATP-binding protein [Gemmatimonadaceae bacterium]